MNMMTINISMPKGLYLEAKKRAKKYHYASVSEVMRDALRWWMNERLTRNGFTPTFERGVLKAAAEPIENSIKWDGKGSFIDFLADNPGKYVQTKVGSEVSKSSERTVSKRTGVESGNRKKSKVVSQKPGRYALE